MCHLELSRSGGLSHSQDGDPHRDQRRPAAPWGTWSLCALKKEECVCRSIWNRVSPAYSKVQTDRLSNTPRYKTHHIKRRLGEEEEEQSSFLVHLLKNNFELKPMVKTVRSVRQG